MIERVIEDWHRFLKGTLPGGLDELLHEDCTFYSPIVFTPQEGREITKLYLMAASKALPGDRPSAGDGDGGADGGGSRPGPGSGSGSGSGSGAFRYTKQVMAGDTAVLEFETTVDGRYVNGVDIIRCDDQGKIVEFRVMIRPLQAVNAVHAQMRAMLESMAPE